MGVSIRLPDERWSHIQEEHSELREMRQEVLGTVADPQRIYEGMHGALMAVREMSPGKFLVVGYNELEEDGFIITAFLTQRVNSLNRRKQVWPVLH